MEEAGRLKSIIDDLFLTPYSFSKSIGVSSDMIYFVLKGKNKISPRLLKAITETYQNINKEWLISGIGEKFTWKEPINKVEEPAIEIIKDVKSLSKEIQQKDFIIEQYQKLITSQRQTIDDLTKIIDTLQKKQ